MQELHGDARLVIDPPSGLRLVSAGTNLDIHPLWLRERCSDAASMDALTGQRLADPSDIDPELAIGCIEWRGDALQVRFSDGHESTFDAAALLSEALLACGSNDCPPMTLWDATLRAPPTAQWETNPAAATLRGWLDAFLRYGFVLLEGSPAVPGAVLDIAAQLGIVRQTNFGTLFDVRSVPNASDLAYTSAPLDPHTDNPYRQPVPGVQLLHCLINESTGGLSTLVDGFAVADNLRQRNPQAFDILRSTPVQFRYRDRNTELTEAAPCIDVDALGRIRAIHFSPRLDFVPLAPRAVLERYYAARREFDHLLRSAAFEIRFLLRPGDVIVFDNLRLLHGRTGFDPAQGERHLQGCYIDLDAIRSRFRVLNRTGH